MRILVVTFPDIMAGLCLGEHTISACHYGSDSEQNNNFTYVPESGGYSDANQMSIDQRGFAYIVQAEAAEFLKSNQLLLNQSVSSIHYNQTGVTVQTAGGYNLTAEHVLVTFSVGVLQNTDVVFDPPLPDWKREAVNSMEMVSDAFRITVTPFP